jgi:hypothetical protein
MNLLHFRFILYRHPEAVEHYLSQKLPSDMCPKAGNETVCSGFLKVKTLLIYRIFHVLVTLPQFSMYPRS